MSTSQNSTTKKIEQRNVSELTPALPFIKFPEDSPFKLAPLQYRQLAEHHHSSKDPRECGQTSVYTIMPVDASSSACKEQRERINEAVKKHTDKPEEIHNCRLGDKLIFAKASLTVAQANKLQNHPDVAVVSDVPGRLIKSL